MSEAPESWHFDRYRLSFIYDISLGAFLEPGSLPEWIDLLSYDSKLFDQLKRFAEGGRPFGTFIAKGDEGPDVLHENERAASREGKNIITRTFVEKHSPLLLAEPDGTPLAAMFTIQVKSDFEEPVSLGQGGQLLVKTTYESCELRLTREGVVSVRFSFLVEPSAPTCSVSTDAFIVHFKQIKTKTREAFKGKLKRLLADLRSFPEWTPMGIIFRSNESEIMDLAELAQNSHHLIFLQGLQDQDGNRIDKNQAIERLTSTRDLLGLLNQASWYSDYRKSLIDETGKKNLAYRADETYITDANTTLVVHPHTFDEPVSIYLSTLTLLVEILFAKMTLIDDLISTVNLEDPDANDDVELCRTIGIKRLVSRLREGLDLHQLVQHGFSRKMLEQFCRERSVRELMEEFDKKADSVYAAASLRWQAASARSGFAETRSARIGTWVGAVAAAVALLVAAASLAVSLIALNRAPAVRSTSSGAGSSGLVGVTRPAPKSTSASETTGASN